MRIASASNLSSGGAGRLSGTGPLPACSTAFGIPVASDLRTEFGDKLKPIERDFYFHAAAVPLPGDAGACIVVVHVQTSPLRPHAGEGLFCIRGGPTGGAAMPWMA